MKFLIVRLGAFGDIVHALPVAAALRRHHPTASIDWLVDARYARLLELATVIDRRIVAAAPVSRIDRELAERRFKGGAGWMKLLGALRAEHYDAALDLQGLLKSALLARGSAARRVLGFARPQLREKSAALFYGETWPPPSGRHVVWKNLSVLPALGLPEPQVPEFPLGEGDTSIVREARRRHATLGDDFVLLNPGAAWPNKRWPAARFGALAPRIRERFGLPSLVVWGPDESGLAEEVVARSEGAAFMSPPTRLPGLLALSRAARLVVSGDTGPLHVGAAAGTPVVALFGPTDPRRNGPWSPADISVSRFDSCDCHYKRKCRRRSVCIADITVEEVLEAVGRRLGGGRILPPDP